MPSPAYLLIRDAIRERKQLHCVYHGRQRSLCPHAVGTKNGIEMVFCYQFAGESERGIEPSSDRLLGPTENWRCLKIEGIEALDIVAGEWHGAANYKSCRPCIDQVVEQYVWAPVPENEEA